ncbi:hypothetical protein, partial [Rhizobium sp. YK2]|uniref:TubC N-terminal docking domain-related protein n=1 Tax=Rhizobium sp. YK2 TaxID=1860096 RepID=UPI000B2D791F
MKFEDLLFELNREEIALSLDGDALIVRAPKKALNDTIKNALVENKNAIIDLINAGTYRSPSHRDVQVPPNAITPASTAIAPDMLPLIALTQSDIDRIVGQVPGGVANIQDIYGLSPLQDGILSHHMLADRGDPYLLVGRMTF